MKSFASSTLLFSAPAALTVFLVLSTNNNAADAKQAASSVPPRGRTSLLRDDVDFNKLRSLEGSMSMMMSIPESLDELSMMTIVNADDAVSLVAPLDGIATEDDVDVGLFDEAAETVIINDNNGGGEDNDNYYNNGPELVQMTDADGRIWYTGEVETVETPVQMTDADGRVWYTGEEAASSSTTLKLSLISVAASFVVALFVMPW
jgi:hypothetical protein